jgi:hypothetical protein
LYFKLRDAARKLLEKELDHLHKHHDAWQIFITKWSNLFNQSYNKETDGALYDQDIRDIFIDEIPCKNISTRKEKNEFLFCFEDNNETTTTTTINEQYKTQQLLSIILIGIVGARYGQEVEQTKQSNMIIKGFTVDSPEMILKLSKKIFKFN